VIEGIHLSQQPLFVPAAAGWYACPGDPPQVTRRWDGKQWLCEIRGPIRDHFDHLRAMSVQGLSPDDLAVLRQLTGEVSSIEDLALSRPTANPPLVQIAAPPPYIPPPVDPYTSAPLPTHAMAGSSSSAASGQRFAGAEKGKGRSGTRKIIVVVALIGILGVVAIGLAFKSIGPALFTRAPASLTVNSCITLSQPSGSTDAQEVTWTSSACTTASGAPVTYTVISKLDGSGTCDVDSQYVQTFTSANAVANTYCLMENLTAGQCVYEDAKGFYFDVACTDSRAAIKVAVSVNQGSGFSCPDGTKSWTFPSGNRTYCLTKP
jgi:hypothetical protein